MARARVAIGGYWLIELGVVVAILAIVAAASLPDGRASDPLLARIAAERLAAALKLAQNEALRTAVPHGVEVARDSSTLRVFRIDPLANPYDISVTAREPVSQRPALYSAATRSLPSDTRFDSAGPGFTFSGYGALDTVLFDAHGLPYWSAGAGQALGRLLSTQLSVRRGSAQETVLLDALSGRVRLP